MIKKLCEIPSPSGGEDEIKEFLINGLSDYTDMYFEDFFGNLIFIKRGQGERLCIECGIDEPFLMVSDFSGGKTHFTAPPHIKASIFNEKNICYSDGNFALIESEKDENEKVTDLFASEKEERQTGDIATIMPCFKKNLENFEAYNIKYKAPAFILAKAIKEIKENNREIYFVFSVQKCLASRGVRALMQSGISFDKVIGISCIEDEFSGVLIVAKEKSCVLTPEVRKEILRLGTEKNIPTKVCFTEDNFNMKLYLTEGEGAPCGLLCLPCLENAVNIENIEFMVKLIVEYCLK